MRYLVCDCENSCYFVDFTIFLKSFFHLCESHWSLPPNVEHLIPTLWSIRVFLVLLTCLHGLTGNIDPYKQSQGNPVLMVWVWSHWRENRSNCDLHTSSGWRWFGGWSRMRHSLLLLVMLPPVAPADTTIFSWKKKWQNDNARPGGFPAQVFSWRSHWTTLTNISSIRTMSQVTFLCKGGKRRSFSG